MSKVKYVCPACREKSGVDILYGLPSEEFLEMAERGEVVLGGCCFEIGGPERECTLCGHRWRIKRRKQASQSEPGFGAE